MLRIRRLAVTAAVVAAASILAFVFTPAHHALARDLYPYGQCTYYAKLVRPDVGNYWGNARYWAASARAAGFPVSSQPRVGDVVVFQPYVQGNSHYGHVAIVTSVQGSQFRTISMWGNEANGRLHVETHHTGGGVSFIHRKGTSTAAAPKKAVAKKAVVKKAVVKHVVAKKAVIKHVVAKKAAVKHVAAKKAVVKPVVAKKAVAKPVVAVHHTVTTPHPAKP